MPTDTTSGRRRAGTAPLGDPSAAPDPSADASAILTEMRNVRAQGLDLTNRLGKLEKHLMDMLKDPE